MSGCSPEVRAEGLAYPAVAPVAAGAEAAGARRHEVLHPALDGMPPVAPIACEHLVAALAREDDLELAGRPLREEGGGQARVVVEQVVRAPHGVGQAAED